MTYRNEPNPAHDESLDLALQALVRHDVPADLGTRVMREIGLERSPLGRIAGLRPVAWAACIVILLVGLAYVFHPSERSETNLLPNPEPAMASVEEVPHSKQERTITQSGVPVPRAEPHRRTRKPQHVVEPVEHLAPWSIPDTYVVATTSWDGVGPPPISEPPAILVHSLELQSVEIGPLRIEPLPAPEPIVLQQKEES